MNYAYPIRYTVDFGKFNKDAAKENQGLTQNLITISCITQPDGSYSQTWVSYNGIEKKAMSSDDVFKAWILMAESLTRKEDLADGKKKFVEEIFDIFKQVFFGTKPQTVKEH